MRSARALRVIILFWLVIAVAGSCKKKNSEREYTRRDDLLGTWSRVLRAYDTNGNHVMEPGERYFAPATDTYLLSLAPDASYQRIQTYKGTQFPFYGTWHLQNSDNDIVLQPTTSSSVTDTFRFDTVSQSYFRFHTIGDNRTWYWEAYERP